jgi:hypothetical protein
MPAAEEISEVRALPNYSPAGFGEGDEDEEDGEEDDGGF